VWYLDCGNHAAAGQILLGSSLETDPEFYNFGGAGMCEAAETITPREPGI